MTWQFLLLYLKSTLQTQVVLQRLNVEEESEGKTINSSKFSGHHLWCYTLLLLQQQQLLLQLLLLPLLLELLIEKSETI
uniref:Putative secreted peptide n=1 Tax=Anopheles braziliensis TaxID=58242 RepID=A0A2M3ZMH5_9DIPT